MVRILTFKAGTWASKPVPAKVRQSKYHQTELRIHADLGSRRVGRLDMRLAVPKSLPRLLPHMLTQLSQSLSGLSEPRL